MMSYAPVAVSDGIAQRPQQQEQQLAVGERSSDNGGVRTELWWWPGPVVTCCTCFSLRSGVGILAARDLLSSLLGMFFDAYVSEYETLFAVLHDQYAENCPSFTGFTPDCEEFEENIDQVEFYLNVSRHFAMIAYVQGFFCIVAGAIGLWAVVFRSTRAAKAYMLSWPPKIVLEVWTALEIRSLQNNYGVEEDTVGIAWLVTLFILVYYFKVSWSYYKKILDHENAHTRSRSASVDMEYHAMPMVAMNTIV